jgi:cellulose synthase/poly-beta-1,6-N-acetylglucosamine synthase-like glycosyltransferase
VTIVVEVVLWLVAVPLGLMSLMLFVECVAALLPAASRVGDSSQPRPSAGVIMPAHDEAAVIGETVAKVLAELGPDDRLVVVADNCSDTTAEIARAGGAEVVERRDAERRGKGYALAAGHAHLVPAPPEVTIVVDADCHPEPGSLETLARQAIATGRPAQSRYDMAVPEGGGVRSAISSLAFAIRGRVRGRGLARLGLPCTLGGTGMAWPWALVGADDLATGDIVEDMRLSVDLTTRGSGPYYCPQATVSSVLPAQDGAEASQRTRWEHGSLSTILSSVPRMVGRAVRRLDLRLLAAAIDQAILPLSLLVVADVLAAGAAATAWAIGWSSIWPFICLAVALGLTVVGVGIGWARFERHRIPARQLLAAPLYVAWKLPMYFSFVVRRQRAWVRTERDVDQTEDA